MQIGIVGAGAIGCYIGGRLVAAGADVVFFGRASVRAELASAGLTTVDLNDARLRCEIVDRFSTNPGVLSAASVLLVCVKSAQTIEVAQLIEPVIRGDARVISFQNGIRNPSELRKILSGRSVGAGIVDFNVRALGNGVFKQATSGALRFEDDDASELANALRAAGFDVHTAANLLPWQWGKLLLNVNNAVNALAGIPLAEQLSSRVHRSIIAAVQGEALQVLNRANIRPQRLGPLPVEWLPTILRLPTPIFRIFLRVQGRVDRNARSSMWQDLDKRRKTEVDYLNGEIVRLAAELKTDAPINRKIVDLVHAVEAKNVGSPVMSADALLAALY